MGSSLRHWQDQVNGTLTIQKDNYVNRPRFQRTSTIVRLHRSSEYVVYFPYLPIADTGLNSDNHTSLGLTAKRYRWNLLEKSQIKTGDGVNINGDINIYADANKVHLDTALRRITKNR